MFPSLRLDRLVLTTMWILEAVYRAHPAPRLTDQQELWLAVARCRSWSMKKGRGYGADTISSQRYLESEHTGVILHGSHVGDAVAVSVGSHLWPTP